MFFRDFTGKRSKEKYEYFCKEIVKKEEVIQKILARYPVLFQCIDHGAQGTLYSRMKCYKYVKRSEMEGASWKRCVQSI